MRNRITLCVCIIHWAPHFKFFLNHFYTLYHFLALQKVIQCIKMVPVGIKIGKEQLNILAYEDDITLIGKMK